MNYHAILLNKKERYIESDSIDFTFQIYDEQNNLVSTLTSFKFKFTLTNSVNILNKEDANYTDGSATQLSVASDKVTAHVVADDTTNYYGEYLIELQMEKKLDATFRQTLFNGYINIIEESVED